MKGERFQKHRVIGHWPILGYGVVGTLAIHPAKSPSRNDIRNIGHYVVAVTDEQERDVRHGVVIGRPPGVPSLFRKRAIHLSNSSLVMWFWLMSSCTISKRLFLNRLKAHAHFEQ
jgi:hypothetical protein